MFNYIIFSTALPKMKVILLGAGYGTRLERDLKSDQTEEHSSLIGVPKPLLPIGKYPLATHWMRNIDNIPEINEVYVVVSIVINMYIKNKHAAKAAQYSTIGGMCQGHCTIKNNTRLTGAAMNFSSSSTRAFKTWMMHFVTLLRSRPRRDQQLL